MSETAETLLYWAEELKDDTNTESETRHSLAMAQQWAGWIIGTGC